MKKILFLALLILTNHAFSFSPNDDPSLEVIDKVKPFTVYLDTKFSKLSTDKSGIVQAALLVEHNYTEETNNEAIWLEREVYFINCRSGTWWLLVRQVTTFDNKKTNTAQQAIMKKLFQILIRKRLLNWFVNA